MVIAPIESNIFTLKISKQRSKSKSLHQLKKTNECWSPLRNMAAACRSPGHLNDNLLVDGWHTCKDTCVLNCLTRRSWGDPQVENKPRWIHDKDQLIIHNIYIYIYIYTDYTSTENKFAPKQCLHVQQCATPIIFCDINKGTVQNHPCPTEGLVTSCNNCPAMLRIGQLGSLAV